MGEKGLAIAIEEAKKGYEEGGVPIGGALISEDGTVLGRGHNLRFQKDSATLHGEISTLENAGRQGQRLQKLHHVHHFVSMFHVLRRLYYVRSQACGGGRERDFYGGRGLDSQAGN